MTIFKKIIDGEIPAKIVHEDEHCIAFRDVNPQAPTHILVIPRQEIPSMDDAKPEHKELIGHLLLTAAEIARKEDVAKSGYRIVTNTHRNAGQSVDHLHFHILGGRRMNWPPG